MTHTPHIRRHLISFLIFICTTALSSNVRTISTTEGLSNNAVFALHQDHLGHIWIGTSDGLNIWNGHTLENYDPKDGQNFFAGNTIRDMFPDGDKGLWIKTYYGIAHIDITTRKITYHDELPISNMMTCSENGIVYLVDRNNSLHYFNKNTGFISKCDLEFISKDENIKLMHCYGRDSLYCFTNRNIYLMTISVDERKKKHDCLLKKKYDADIEFVSSTPNGSNCHFISNKTKDIYTFDMEDGEINCYAPIGKYFPKDERVRAILPYNNGVYVGLSVSGVWFITPDNKIATTTPINTGVFTLLKDNRQNIVWAGTDGSGLMNLHIDDLIFEEISYSKLPVPVKMPVRSILLDKKGKLWCGTKGDGIFTISDFAPFMQLNEQNVKKITTSNSSLVNNNVYSISEGGDGKGIWIGTDGSGINWYSYSTNTISIVPGSTTIRHIHVIYEQNNNTLWIGTHGDGVFRCAFTRTSNGTPIITAIEKFHFPDNFVEGERIFSIYAPDEHTIWFGSRGSGAAHLDTRNGIVHIHNFSTDKGRSSNDIFGIASTDKVHFASGCGLISYDYYEDTYTIADEIPHRSIHGILSEENGNLWMSTNYGLICLKEDNRRVVIYGHHSGLNILEYSDGACFKDNTDGTLFFGGINGVTTIRDNRQTDQNSTEYIPTIDFTHHISNNIHTPLCGNNLKIPYSNTTFGIRFSVVDNINYQDYVFYYRIIGFNNEWKSNLNSDIIHLPTLPPGKYTLEVRYHNNSNSYTSESQKLHITIVPPIYATWWAKTLYILTAMIIAGYFVKRLRKKYQSLKEELRRSKELNEIEPLFLANMLHIINENLDNPDLSVTFLADRLCISSRGLHRKFENTPNLKPQKLIREARMKAAAEMLSSSETLIDEIMVKVGYDNRGTFYKNFKEIYGLTPKEYRKQAQKRLKES